MFVHQQDTREFNRGAMKNIGFIVATRLYPNDYKNITFVFNDIDTIPFSAIFDYETVPGIVKHFYGFDYSLGGIVALNGSDFEAINGFPNFWGWGYEDNVILKRANNHNIFINRSNFFEIGNHNILHLIDEFSKNISIKAQNDYANNNIVDGLNTLSNINYMYNDSLDMLDINTFNCIYSPYEKTVNTSLFNKQTKRIPNPIGKFNFYNFK